MVYKVSSQQFVSMSETHIKVIQDNGYRIIIDNAEQDTSNIVATTNTKSVSTKVADTKVSKPASKVAQKSTPKAKALRLKKGIFFKTVNPNTNKVGFVGKVKSIDFKAKTLTAMNKKLYSLPQCKAISESEFRELKQTIKSSKASKEPKVSNSNRLSPKDYKVVYALNLLSLGKIDQEYFDDVKNDDKLLAELYSQFKNEVKLSNADALKLFAQYAKHVAC